MHVLTILNEDLLNTLLGSSDGLTAKAKAQRHFDIPIADKFASKVALMTVVVHQSTVVTGV